MCTPSDWREPGSRVIHDALAVFAYELRIQRKPLHHTPGLLMDARASQYCTSTCTEEPAWAQARACIEKRT